MTLTYTKQFDHRSDGIRKNEVVVTCVAGWASMRKCKYFLLNSEAPNEFHVTIKFTYT